MNILPKKSWHVRTYKNIEKVRQDEAKAAEEERQRQARIELAEQEARTDYMRKRARQLGGGNVQDVGQQLIATSSQSSASQQEQGADGQEQQQTSSVPFRLADIFADIKEGKGDKRQNVERLSEAKAEQEKWEKRIGLLQYLSEGGEEKPWYLDSHDVRMKLSEPQKKLPELAASASDKEAKESRNKHYHDPLNTMHMYLDQMKRNDSQKNLPQPPAAVPSKSDKNRQSSFSGDRKEIRESRSSGRKSRDSVSSSSKSKPIKEMFDPTTKRRHLDGEKKKKKSKKHKRKSRGGSDSEGLSSKGEERAERTMECSVSSASSDHKKANLEKLRAERLAREKTECERTRQLLRRSEPTKAADMDERTRSYNSQFNPHLMKRNARH